jgi:MmyB-like transcription regulator ligand binding domain
MVAELRDALGRYPARHLIALIEDLHALSARFAELWELRPVVREHARRKTFRHPEVGTITLDCDELSVAGTDLNVIVYTASSGSRDANSLALLGAVGLQAFSS